MKFKLNDEVKWSSSSNGVTKVKIGFIVEVIPPGVNVKKFELGRLLDAPGLPRKEESYIVCVGPRPGYRRVKSPNAGTNQHWAIEGREYRVNVPDNS